MNTHTQNSACSTFGHRHNPARGTGRHGLRRWFPAGAAAWLLAAAGSARADSVGMLVNRLATHSNYKVRSTAALVLSKSCDTRAYEALVQALKSDSSMEVRATAASSLARLGLTDCVPALKKASRAGDSQLKSRARAALDRLCPSVGRKRYYVNLDRITYRGPSAGKVAVRMARCRLSRFLRRQSDVTVAWPKCKTPSKRDLSKKRVRGVYLDVVVKVKSSGGSISCRVTPTFWSYPRAKLLTTGGGARVRITGNMSPGVIDTCLSHAVGSIQGDIVQTLRRL